MVPLGVKMHQELSCGGLQRSPPKKIMRPRHSSFTDRTERSIFESGSATSGIVGVQSSVSEGVAGVRGKTRLYNRLRRGWFFTHRVVNSRATRTGLRTTCTVPDGGRQKP
jgi:hypothetical protein